LTEIAIVLGIIGLILGAIWVAASAVYQNLRNSKATTELLTIAQGIRTMYATSAQVDPNANMTSWGANAQGVGFPRTYLQAGLFPTDATDQGNPNLNTRAIDPWQGNIVVQATSGLVAGDNLGFVVVFDNVPQSACIALLTGNTGTGRDQSMIAAGAGAVGAVPAGAILGGGAPPITASQAQTACGAALNAVGFSFKVKG
jgi:hypothetical protein